MRPLQPIGCAPALGEDFPQILQAARLGEEWAWRTIYREMAPAVIGYLHARGAAEPEDILGEVFVQVVRHLATFEGDAGALRAWVFTIAHNRLVDERRGRARRPAESATTELLEAQGPIGDTEQEGLAALELADMRRVIAQLTPDQQSVLLLRIVADLTVEDTARVLGKRLGAVKALQRRALAAVESRLRKEGVPL